MDKSEEIIVTLVKQLGKKMENVTDETRIKEDLGADSLDVVEILLTIEEKYGVSVPNEVVMDIKTIGDLKKMLANLK